MSAIELASTVLIPLGYVGCYLWDWLKEPLRNKKESVILLPLKGGKSTLANSLKTLSRHYRLIDLDELLITKASKEQRMELLRANRSTNETARDITKYSITTDIIKQLKDTILKPKGKRSIYLSSDIDVVLDLFHQNDICVAWQSETLFNTTMNRFADADKERALASRNKFKSQFAQEMALGKIHVYNSYADLAKLVCSQFNLSHKD